MTVWARRVPGGDDAPPGGPSPGSFPAGARAAQDPWKVPTLPQIVPRVADAPPIGEEAAPAEPAEPAVIALAAVPHTVPSEPTVPSDPAVLPARVWPPPLPPSGEEAPAGEPPEPIDIMVPAVPQLPAWD